MTGEYGAAGAAVFERLQVDRAHADWPLFRAAIPATTRLLDLGTGTGRLLLQCWRDGIAADGVDNSRAMHHRFTERSVGIQSRGRYFLADFVSFQPRPGAYGAVLLSRNTAGCVANCGALSGLFAVVAQALAKGGVALVDVDHFVLTAPVELEETIDRHGVAAIARTTHRPGDADARTTFRLDGTLRDRGRILPLRIRGGNRIWRSEELDAAAAASGLATSGTLENYGRAAGPRTYYSRIHVYRKR